MSQITVKSSSVGGLPVIEITNEINEVSETKPKKQKIKENLIILNNHEQNMENNPVQSCLNGQNTSVQTDSRLNALKGCVSDTLTALAPEETKQDIGVSFAQEAKDFCFKKRNIFIQNANPQRHILPIYIHQATHKIPVVNKRISGSRLIYDSASLLNYCIKWCQSVYYGKIELHAICNSGTLLIVFPKKSSHFIQFIYNKSAPSESQRQFQLSVYPSSVLVFHSFMEFAHWIKNQGVYDA